MRTRSFLLPTLLGTLGLLAASCSDEIDVSAVKGELAGQDVDFGRVQVGILMPYTLVMKNVGTGALQVTSIELGPDFSVAGHEFKIADAAGFTLSSNQERSIALSFRPYVEQAAPVESYLKFITDVKDSAGAFVSFTVRLTGQGIKSGLEVMPNPVDFGTVLVGRPKDLQVTIKNTLSVDVDVFSRLDDQGRPQIINQAGLGRFEILSPVQASGSLLAAGTKLPANQSITIDVRYVPDPAQEGVEDRGKWTIANCEDAVCDVPVTMIGRGTNSAVSCMPSPIAFGDVNPGVTVTQRTTCTNVADDTVTVTGWRLDTGSAPEYSVVAYNGTPSLLEAGASFVVETQFSPALGSVGQMLQGSLVITGRNSRAGRDLNPARIPITGRAGGPDINVLPAQLNFGQVAIGTTAKKRIIIENAGYSDLTVTQIDPDADNTSQYTVDRTSFAVPRQSTVVLEVSFAPTAAGNITSRLIIDSDDTDEASVVVPLQGVGVELPPCSFTLEPAAVNFGIVQVLRSSIQGVRIENTGTAACLVNDIEIKAGSSPAYSLTNGNETGLMIPPGGEHTILVEYMPPGEGVMMGELTFYISNPTTSNPIVALRGVGSASALLITPNELNFGKIGLNCATRERAITIYNTGANTTRIMRIERPAGVTTEFEILPGSVPAGIPAPPNAGAPIAPGQSIEFAVRYRSADIGLDSGFIHIFEQNRTDPYVIPLFGEGSNDPVNEDSFRQLDTPQVDVLWVIDNSCSMSEEQNALTGNFASFIQFADAQALDYRLAVVTTDIEGFGIGGQQCPTNPQAQRPMGTPQGACGYFADGNATQSDPAWRLVTPDEQPSAEAAFTAIASQGIDGSGNETGLAAAYQALSAPLINGWNNGFLRPDAYLALIFVSDEPDFSIGTVDFYVNFFKAIKGFRNTNLFSASAIVGDAGQGCNGPGGNAGGGDRYISVAQQTGGIFESICTSSWSNALQNLGLNVFGYKSRFFLSNTPVAGTIEVLVDGVRVEQQAMSGQVRWGYDGATNAVNFAPLAIPEPGSEIIVRYVAECL
jgi:hypothetical protein